MGGRGERNEQLVIELYVGNVKESKEFYRSLGFEVDRESTLRFERLHHYRSRWFGVAFCYPYFGS